MDRLRSLRLFVRVVELGSFSRAAAELGIGQPTATKQIVRLEQELGVRLLHRSTHDVTPTEIGAAYYEKCRVICHHVAEADSLATLLNSRLEGSVRIGTSVAFGVRVLGPLLMDFMRQHPSVQVDLDLDDQYVNPIEKGLDLAVRLGRLADSNFGSRRLGVNPWVLAASPGFLARHPPVRAPEDLTGIDALVYSTAQGAGNWTFTSPDGRRSSVNVQGPLRSNGLQVLLQAAEAGMGVCALPMYVAHEALAAGRLATVLESWRLPSQEIHAIYPSPRMIPTKVSSLVGWLIGRLQSDGWWVPGPSSG